ncbi:hypothetical protein [Streptomyces sp. NPDC054765]
MARTQQREGHHPAGDDEATVDPCRDAAQGNSEERRAESSASAVMRQIGLLTS